MHLHRTHSFPWGSILPRRTVRTRQTLQAKIFARVIFFNDFQELSESLDVYKVLTSTPGSPGRPGFPGNPGNPSFPLGPYKI